MAAIFAAVLKISLSAGLLALLVLFARAALTRRPGALMPMLYALLILRLLLPFSVPSPLSLENLMRIPAAQTVQAFADIPAADANGTAQDDRADAADTDVSAAAVDAQASPAIAQPAAASSLSPFEIAAWVWAAGAAAGFLFIAAGHLRFARALRRNRPYADPGFDDLLASCMRELIVRRRVETVRFSGVNAAAVYGVLRPRLLICPQRFEALSETEQRHVLLHELAHIKRGDTAVSLLAALLGALHWFNPVALIVLALLRRDLESFCDAAVLKMMDSEGRRDYARTLLKLSEGGQLRLYPALSISKTPLKRRIRMISRYKKNTPLYTALALLLTVVIAAAGCTSAVETQSAQGQTAETQAASPSVQVTYSQIKTEKDFDSSDYIISGMGGNGEFIWQISLGSYDEAAVSNINKAAELLDGTVIARGDSLDLVALLGEITETNGWMATDEQGTETLYNAFLPGSFHSNDPAKMADHLGGGAEIVLIALAGSADAVGCDVALEAVDDSTLVGGVTITNDQYDTGLELRVSASKHMLIVAARDASLPYGKPVLFPPLD